MYIKNAACWRGYLLILVLTASLLRPNVVSSEAFSTPASFGRRTTTRSKPCNGRGHVDVTQKGNWKFPTADSGSPYADTQLRGGSDDDSASSGTVAAKSPLVRELMAEMIGTFLIVMIGTGSVMSAVYTDSLVGLFQIASVWIIAVTVAICTTASISGAHLNPAVSIAFAMLRPSSSFNWSKVIPYVFSQTAGAVLGSLVNLVLFSSSITAFESANNIVRGSASGIASAKAFGEYFVAPISASTAFLAEAVGTGILAFVIFALTHPKNDTMKDGGFVPPIIGMTVGALIAVLAPLTQAGFNPARDFGPRIVAFLAGWKSVAFQGCWVYIVGPIVGAIAGAAVADKVLYADD